MLRDLMESDADLVRLLRFAIPPCPENPLDTDEVAVTDALSGVRKVWPVASGSAVLNIIITDLNLVSIGTILGRKDEYF